MALLCSQPLQAREIEGVDFSESINIDGTELILNGAGIRTKFFFSIYIGALYTTEKSSTPEQVFSNTKAKRIVMHILYKELSAEKITNGWIDGFRNNHSTKVFQQLEPRLKIFNSLFTTTKKGDVITLDYNPSRGTSVRINNEMRGTVVGSDFNIALLRVWLGDNPADSNLKEAMLGND